MGREADILRGSSSWQVADGGGAHKFGKFPMEGGTFFGSADLKKKPAKPNFLRILDKNKTKKNFKQNS